MSRSSSSDEEPEDSYEVESVIGKRVVRGKTEYRVMWKNYSIEDATWEPVENLEGSHLLIEEFEATDKKKKSRGKLESSPEAEPEEPAKKRTKTAKTTDSARSAAPRRSRVADEQKTADAAPRGLDAGWTPQRVLGATDTGGDGLKFLIQWKEDSTPDLVGNKLVRKHCPQLLLDFYESRVQFEQFSEND